MSKKRAQYSRVFKAKIAFAAIRGEETVPQFSAVIRSTRRKLKVGIVI